MYMLIYSDLYPVNKLYLNSAGIVIIDRDQSWNYSIDHKIK